MKCISLGVIWTKTAAIHIESHPDAIAQGRNKQHQQPGNYRQAAFDVEQQSNAAEERTLEAERGRARLDQAKAIVQQTIDDIGGDVEVAPAVVDLSGVQFVTLQQFGYANTGGGGFSLGSSTAQFPTEPLDVPLRRPSGHFQWQRDPFTPAKPNEGNPRAEKIGLDLVLPYWMGRYHGAFK